MSWFTSSKNVRTVTWELDIRDFGTEPYVIRRIVAHSSWSSRDISQWYFATEDEAKAFYTKHHDLPFILGVYQ